MSVVSLETPRETGFHKTTRNCLQHIREVLLHHRWQDAAEYMASYSQTLEDTTANMPQLYAEVGQSLHWLKLSQRVAERYCINAKFDFFKLCLSDHLEDRHRDTTPPSQLDAGRLQQFLWASETLRSKALPEGRFHNWPLDLYTISPTKGP